MPPKKKDDLKQIVPIFGAEKLPPIFWIYEQFSLEMRQQLDAFFVNFQKELQIKMTDNIYTNMEFLATSIGSRLNPLFKLLAHDDQMGAKTLKEIESEEQKNQLNTELAKSQKGIKVPLVDPKTAKKEDQKQAPGVSTGKDTKDDGKKNAKKDDPAAAQNGKDLKKATELELPDNEEDVKQELPPYLLITNQRIDYLTMKMLLFSLPSTNITTLKFNNNLFDDETLELLTAFFNSEASAKIKKLFFEWNDLKNSEKRSVFYQNIAKSTQLDNLVLRCNAFKNDITASIMQSFIPTPTTPASNIKFLDLYDNQISAEGFKEIGNMIYKNKVLQTLGLAKNGISDISAIERILISIGRYPMSEEQYQAYRNSEKERDQIIERNKKLKGKKVLEAEPVPELEPIEQVADNKWVIARNNTLAMLNLSLNQLGEDSVERLESFLPVTHDNFQIILTFNNYDQRAKERLKKRFTKKIAL